MEPVTERVWRIIEPNGTVHTVDESLASKLASVNNVSARESVTFLATRRDWPVAEVLAHGEVSRAELIAALRAMADTFCLYCDFADDDDVACPKYATTQYESGMTVCDEHHDEFVGTDDGVSMPHADTLRMLNGESRTNGAVIASIATPTRVGVEV